ncbi:precorrin-2 dehydrogenase/sirohydrochlorin ferrochelatase family protein [Paenibacillus harenae]|uniref:precorrin-2 dehydrogenase n=1 Tax=Paenibacillus harenae TaxID=306543 RepID=A0ABT9TUW4_PAEHA|nr:bifunctional precorrin-2 dehydrogenase/sirohydrochlorin ferrochelatase [Paenibacillus harenae]MDQ0110862.1 precorrin-2 dehydrogenase/sirohydrochlorin ferrochelatase [Paenibacillus harenae]
MNGYYPIVLQLRGKKIVVIGGGAVAERKVNGLLEAGADNVKVVSPIVTERIAALAEEGKLRLELRSYKESDACGARLLFAATGNEVVNAAVAADGERYGAFVNAADSYEDGDFLVPSVIRRGDLLLSVTATGASPSLAAAIKKELEAQYGEAYGKAASRLRRLRALIMKSKLDRVDKQAVLKLAAEEAVEAARTGVWTEEGNGKEESDEVWLNGLLHRVGLTGGVHNERNS